MTEPYGTIAKYRNVLAIKKHNAIIQPWASAMALDVAAVFWATWKGIEERLPKGDEILEAEKPRDSRDLKNKYSAIIRVEVKRHSAELQRVIENYIYRVWLAGAVEQCRDLGCTGWFFSSLSKSSTSSESTSAPDGTSLQEAPRVRNVKADKSGWVSLPNLRAQEYAKKHAAEAVTQINDTTRKEIARIVSDGVESGSSYNDIAKAIKNKFEEFAVPMPQKHVSNRAVLVAVTELANAYCEGNAQVGNYLQDNGVKMMKAWQTLEDDRVSDGCKENERVGWIPINKEFPSGHMHPPRFPGCRCDFLQDILEEDMLGKPIDALYGKQYTNSAVKITKSSSSKTPSSQTKQVTYGEKTKSGVRVYSQGQGLFDQDHIDALMGLVKTSEHEQEVSRLLKEMLRVRRSDADQASAYMKIEGLKKEARDLKYEGAWPSCIEYIVQSQGFDMLPQKVSKRKIRKKDALYRGIVAKDEETLRGYHDALVNGTWYYSAAGGSLYGKGMYASRYEGMAKKYAADSDHSLVEKMQYTKGAKVADVDLWAYGGASKWLKEYHSDEMDLLRRSYNKAFSLDMSEDEFYSAIGDGFLGIEASDIIAALGYDGVDIDQGSIHIVFNRSALEVADDDI